MDPRTRQAWCYHYLNQPEPTIFVGSLYEAGFWLVQVAQQCPTDFLKCNEDSPKEKRRPMQPLLESSGICKWRAAAQRMTPPACRVPILFLQRCALLRGLQSIKEPQKGSWLRATPISNLHPLRVTCLHYIVIIGLYIHLIANPNPLFCRVPIDFI